MDRIEQLSDFEHRHLVHMLSESHPKILKGLLDRLDDHRRSVEVREAMPPHPFTPHDTITGLRYCYLSIAGTPCLRDADHRVHTAATDPTSSPAANDHLFDDEAGES
jgi:hypothetical protein